MDKTSPAKVSPDGYSYRPDLAKLQVTQSEMPLSEKDRASLIYWLRELAGEIERGEHFSTSVFVLGGNRVNRQR